VTNTSHGYYHTGHREQPIATDPIADVLEVHARTHAGLLHPRNEDSFRVVDVPGGGALLVVCDGMGGMGRGDEASALAASDLVDSLASVSAAGVTVIRHALLHADERVRRELCSGPEGLTGCTAVVVHVVRGHALVGWAGDSRAYHIRERGVVARTRDHKLVEDLVDAGELTPEEARVSSLSRVVTRAIGGRARSAPPVVPAVLPEPWRLETGDALLLCSDGLCDLVNDAEIADVVGRYPPPVASEILVDTALARGGHDNITAIVAVWRGPPGTADEFPTQPINLEGLASTVRPAPTRRETDGASLKGAALFAFALTVLAVVAVVLAGLAMSAMK
jgi:serine/threonine protein phosphatase PrpC